MTIFRWQVLLKVFLFCSHRHVFGFLIRNLRTEDSIGRRCRRHHEDAPCTSIHHSGRSEMITLFMTNDNVNDNSACLLDSKNLASRRMFWKKLASKTLVATTTASAAMSAVAVPCAHAHERSRTEGYVLQMTEEEWKQALSPVQYDSLRKGTDERPGYSILEGEMRPGIYACAGCRTPVFASDDKFNSGTGWPTFARSLSTVQLEHNDNLETQHHNHNIRDSFVYEASLSLTGVELRCSVCGGHLGDLFYDGFLFAGTPAAQTGLRYSIDGSSLVFYPNATLSPPSMVVEMNGEQQQQQQQQQLYVVASTMSGDEYSSMPSNSWTPVRGDTPEPKEFRSELPAFLESPMTYHHHHHQHPDQK